MRKRSAALMLFVLVLAGCETLGESAGMGALVGAGGAALVGGNMATGAVIGGVAGAACFQTNTC